VKHGCSEMIPLTMLITEKKKNLGKTDTRVMVVQPIHVLLNIKEQWYSYMPLGLKLMNQILCPENFNSFSK
jgi:hypothetical protein